MIQPRPSPPSPNPRKTHRRSVSMFTGTGRTSLVTCRFCGVTGKRQTMIVPCACNEQDERYIHRSCLNVQRWTDPDPVSFKKCTACQLDYHMDLRIGANPEKTPAAKVLRYVCSDAFALIFFLLTCMAILTGIVERLDSCGTAPGGCGEHCTGCCNLLPGVNATGICPRGGNLLNKYGILDNDYNGGVQYMTSYFVFGSILFGILLGIVGFLDICCVVNEDGTRQTVNDQDVDEYNESVNPIVSGEQREHRSTSSLSNTSTGQEKNSNTKDTTSTTTATTTSTNHAGNTDSNSPFSFLLYVYCCMCMQGNAKKGYRSFKRDVCVNRKCMWTSELSKASKGCNDISFLIGFYFIVGVMTVIFFATAGAVVGIVLLTITFAKVVRRHRKLMKRRLRVKDYIVKDLSMMLDGEEQDEDVENDNLDRRTLMSGTRSAGARGGMHDPPPPPRPKSSAPGASRSSLVGGQSQFGRWAHMKAKRDSQVDPNVLYELREFD